MSITSTYLIKVNVFEVKNRQEVVLRRPYTTIVNKNVKQFRISQERLTSDSYKKR